MKQSYISENEFFNEDRRLVIPNYSFSVTNKIYKITYAHSSRVVITLASFEDPIVIFVSNVANAQVHTTFVSAAKRRTIRSRTNVSLALSRRPLRRGFAVITVILIIALHNYQAHRRLPSARDSCVPLVGRPSSPAHRRNEPNDLRKNHRD